MANVSKNFKLLLILMAFALSIFWLIIIVTESIHLKEDYEERARETATAYTKSIKDFRIWIARHDGVYVRTTESTPPSPFLEGDNAAMTTDGVMLTKVNPAYGSRQLAELSQENAGLNFRIVSANPVNEDNRADDWEASALADFWDVNVYTDGDYAHIIEVREDGRKIFRTIRPIFIVEECVSCHVEENNEVGYLRGGISVSLDYTGYEEAWREHNQRNNILFSLAFVSSLLVLIIFGRKILSNLSEREELYDQMEHIAQTDKLTGLANRYYFMMRLDIEIRRYFRHQTPLALLMVDLNKFKEINDNHGHAAGDLVLQKVAETLVTSIRGTDVAARIGGDEFIIMLTDASKEDAMQYAYRLKAELEAAKAFYHGEKLDICASIGVAFIGEVTDIETDLENITKIKDNFIHQADQAMYVAKAVHRSQGGSHVACYNDVCNSAKNNPKNQDES